MPLNSDNTTDVSRIEFHRQNPDLSLESYMREKRIEAGKLATSRKRIYLDLRFWILLRDVHLGRNQDGATSDLLALLKSSVSECKSICPISESVLIEILKQTDDMTRLATAELIDTLSLGVSLIPFDERVCQELSNAIYEQAGAQELFSVQDLVWTKLVYVLGETHPSDMRFLPEDELAIQKAFADYLWYISLSNIIEKLGVPDTSVDMDAVAKKLNAENEKHQSVLRSYVQAFRIEFIGGLSLFAEVMQALFLECDQRGYKDFGAKWTDLSNKKRFEAFAQSVPSLYINAACHAAVRWDQKRQLTGNDIIDFHHAHAALAYCDVFLTERALSTLLCQKHLGLNRYKCQMFWSPAKALCWLQEQGY